MHSSLEEFEWTGTLEEVEETVEQLSAHINRASVLSQEGEKLGRVNRLYFGKESIGGKMPTGRRCITGSMPDDLGGFN